MKPVFCVAAAALLAATPLAAQQRTLFVSLYGGGADHLSDLKAGGAVSGASFSPGYNIGASAGIQLSSHFSVLGDFTYTRNGAWGQASFRGFDVNRFFWGVDVQARYPLANGLEPFVLAGVGGVSVDQLGLDQFRPFDQPTATIGGGASYDIPRTRLAALAQVKGVTYRWKVAGFDRSMFDVTYSVGMTLKLEY